MYARKAILENKQVFYYFGAYLLKKVENGTSTVD